MTRSAVFSVRSACLVLGLALAFQLLQPQRAFAAATTLSLNKQVQNVTTGSGYSTSVSAHPGDTLQYAIAYQNTGSNTATATTITDQLLAGQTLVPSSCTAPACTATGNTVTFNVGDIAPLGSGTVYVSATVDTGFSGAITNAATASSTAPATATSNATTVTVAPTSTTTTLSVTKFVCPATTPSCTSTSITATAGEQIVYRINVSNIGTIAATNLTVTDTLQSAQTYVSCTPTPCTAALNTVTFTTPTLAAGATYTAYITATINSGFSGSINNSATASAANAAAASSGATTVTVGTTPPPPTTTILSLTKQASDATLGSSYGTTIFARPGDLVRYRLVVTNTSTTTSATSVTVSDQIPSGEVYANGTCSGATACGFNGSAVTFTISSLTPGMSVVLLFDTYVNQTTVYGGQTITNAATASASNAGSTTSNSVTVTLQGQQPPPPSPIYPSPVYPSPYPFPYQPSTATICGIVTAYTAPAASPGYITMNGETFTIMPGAVPVGTVIAPSSFICITFSVNAFGQLSALIVSTNVAQASYVCGPVYPYNPNLYVYPYAPYPGYTNPPTTTTMPYGPYPYAPNMYGYTGPMVIGGYPFQVNPNTYFPYSPQFNNPYCFTMSPYGAVNGSLSTVPIAAFAVEDASATKIGHEFVN